MLGLGQLGGLDLENGRQLTLPVHAGLISRSQADQADACDHHQPQLHAKANDAIQKFLLAQGGRNNGRPGLGGHGGRGLGAPSLADRLAGGGAGRTGMVPGGGTPRTAAGLRGGVDGSGGTGSHRSGLGS